MINLNLDDVIRKMFLNECLLCKTNLKEEFKDRNFHIFLCKKHRLEYLDKMGREGMIEQSKLNKIRKLNEHRRVFKSAWNRTIL